MDDSRRDPRIHARVEGISNDCKSFEKEAIELCATTNIDDNI